MIRIACLLNKVIAIVLRILGRTSYKLSLYSTPVNHTESKVDPTVRTTFVNYCNEQLVRAALRNDTLYFLKHIFEQDIVNVNINYDENITLRYGLSLIAEDIARKETAATIVDIACGNCSLLRAIKAMNASHLTIGVDASPVRVLINQQHADRMYFSFAENLPIDDSRIDVVVATEALEHVMDVNATLKELIRILKPGGQIYCQVPLGEFADGTNHLRHFDRDTLVEVFEINGAVVDMTLIIPYLVGQEPNNIYLKAHKPFAPAGD